MKLKIGDKVKYIGIYEHLDRDKIYTIYYVSSDGEYGCINEIYHNPMPMYYYKDFECLRVERKKKLNKILKNKSLIRRLFK